MFEWIPFVLVKRIARMFKFKSVKHGPLKVILCQAGRVALLDILLQDFAIKYNNYVACFHSTPDAHYVWVHIFQLISDILKLTTRMAIELVEITTYGLINELK